MKQFLRNFKFYGTHYKIIKNHHFLKYFRKTSLSTFPIIFMSLTLFDKKQ